MKSNRTNTGWSLTGLSCKRTAAFVTLFFVQMILRAANATTDSLNKLAAKDTAVADSTSAAMNNSAAGKESDNLVLEVGISVAVIAIIVVVTWLMSSGGKKGKDAQPGSSNPHPKPHHPVHHHHHARR